MVNIIPEAPGFGARLARGLGAGTTHGVDKATDFAQKVMTEKMKQKEETKNLQETYDSILNEMEGLTQDVGPLKGIGATLNPWSETAGRRSKINTLRLSLEGLFRDLTLKGQFPKAIYERILQELPNASDTQSQYKNKISAIKDILSAHYGTKSKSFSGQEKTTNIGKKIPVRAPNGKIKMIDESQLDAALKAGGTLQ